VTLWAFYCLGAFSALSIFDLPLIGLSITAPIFALVAFPTLFKPPEPWFRRYRGCLFLAAAIWLGSLASFLVNGPLSATNQTEMSHILPVVRYGYWLLVFVVTANFAAQPSLLSRLSVVLAVSISILAFLRLFEAAAWGKIGTSIEPRLLTQNSYGGLFSTFSPFLLVFLVEPKGMRRVISAAGLLIVWGAAAINGSRGSWIGITVGLVTFVAFYSLSAPRQAWRLIVPLFLSSCLFAGVMASSARVREVVVSRFSTLQKLETDKSYMERQVLNQKSWQLFCSSPLVGVGPGRYRETYAFLELPEFFNPAVETHLNTKSAHNSYLLFIAEMGLVGALPFCCLLLFLAVRGLHTAWKLTRRGQVWALGILASFAGMTVHLWAMAALTNTATWFVYGLLVASIMAAKQIELRHKHPVNICSLKGKPGVGGRPRQLGASTALAQS